MVKQPCSAFLTPFPPFLEKYTQCYYCLMFLLFIFEFQANGKSPFVLRRRPPNNTSFEFQYLLFQKISFFSGAKSRAEICLG